MVEASALPWGAGTCPCVPAVAGGSVPHGGGGMGCSLSSWAEVAGALGRRGGTWRVPGNAQSAEEPSPCKSALNLEIQCSSGSQFS